MNISVRSRLTLTYTLLTGGIVLLFSIVLYGLVSHQLEKIFQEDILWEAETATALFLENNQTALADLDEMTKELEISFVFRDAQTGALLYASSHSSRDQHPDLKDLAMASPKAGAWSYRKLENEPHSIWGQAFSDPTGRAYNIQVIAPIRDLREIQNSILFWLLILVPSTVAIVVVVGRSFSKNTLQPLEEGFARMKQFTADASHELRIPITTIKGTAEVALRSDRSLPEYKEALQDILEEGHRLESLAEDLLALARADGARSAIQKTLTDLKAFVDDIYAQATQLKNDLTVKIHLDNVPALYVDMDASLIRRAMINLIENALHYNKTGGDIWIGAEKARGHVIIYVKDNGMGIPNASQSKIFERFFRVDKARSRRQGGAGLGLSIVKSIVEAHGGSVRLSSELNHGSTFQIVLPLD